MSRVAEKQTAICNRGGKFWVLVTERKAADDGEGCAQRRTNKHDCSIVNKHALDQEFVTRLGNRRIFWGWVSKTGSAGEDTPGATKEGDEKGRLIAHTNNMNARTLESSRKVDQLALVQDVIEREIDLSIADEVAYINSAVDIPHLPRGHGCGLRGRIFKGGKAALGGN